MSALVLEESEDHRLIRKSVSESVSRFDLMYWVSKEKAREFPGEFWDEMARHGWFGINIPTEYGGAGYGMLETSLLINEVARSGAGVTGADLFLLTCTLVSEPIILGGSEDLKERYLPSIAEGRIKGCFAVTEPEAGVNTFDTRTIARREGDGFVITGKKIWTTLAHLADIMILLTRTTPREKAPRKTHGLTIFLVDLRTRESKNAVRITPIDKLSMVPLGSNEVFIDGLRVPEENVLGGVDEGWGCLAPVLNAERIATGAMCSGTGELVIRRAAEYSRQRVVFGRPIGMNQGIQFPLAHYAAELEAAWNMTLRAAWLYDRRSDETPFAASVAAYLAARAAFMAADRAIQTYGGMGFGRDNDIERHWRDLRLFRTAPIPEEMTLNYIAQHRLGLPRSY